MRGETKHHDSERKRQEKERTLRKSIGLLWPGHSEDLRGLVPVKLLTLPRWYPAVRDR
ncbi:MAG: hypothetical protein ABIK44_00675 [candidate division WOR-3 bacterium]